MRTDGVGALGPGPAVSVLVTTYAHATFVEEALDSLVAQTCRDFEVIITDDASPDDTAAVIRRWLDRTGFPASFVPNPLNQGICANRNQALRSATGEFVCSLSGDDAYEPRRIERQLAFFRAQPATVAAVYSDMVSVDGSGRAQPGTFLASTLGGRSAPEGRDLLERLLTEGNILPAPATMIRRSCIDAVGGYDESIRVEDYQMWLKLAERWELRCLPEVLVRNRVLGSSLSRAARYREVNRRATAQVLAPWLGRTEWDPAVGARLWKLGRAQLRNHDADGATWTFRQLAAHDRRLRVRAVAILVGHPVGRRAIGALAGGRRRLPRPLRRRLGDRG